MRLATKEAAFRRAQQAEETGGRLPDRSQVGALLFGQRSPGEGDLGALRIEPLRRRERPLRAVEPALAARLQTQRRGAEREIHQPRHADLPGAGVERAQGFVGLCRIVLVEAADPLEPGLLQSMQRMLGATGELETGRRAGALARDRRDDRGERQENSEEVPVPATG